MQDTNPVSTMMDVPQASAAEATAAFREFAEKGIGQAKDAYAKMKTAAEEAKTTLATP